MEQLTTIFEVKEQLDTHKKSGKKIGFVPTMGALHEGHLSLVEHAKTQCDIIVVSIFVNPTQFNNATDLEKYPRTIENDINLLKNNNVDYVFTPSIDEIYPSNYQAPTIDLGILDSVMEGEFRPGHFQGVVQVVKRLFEIVEPNLAFFGQKDFQQVAVIKYMTNYFKLPVEIIPCPIIRNEKGLALSSRNMRLSEEEKEKALVIYNTLIFAKENIGNFSPSELMKECAVRINAGGLETEYVQIVNMNTLETLEKWENNAVCCIVAYCGEIRLIDNMILN
ncbi:MAG TPA: pantoate--beta-alanine ligase [Taishania sp.]|nr:pantoate--beta-alanine ligase [Taishania sp.]